MVNTSYIAYFGGSEENNQPGLLCHQTVDCTIGNRTQECDFSHVFFWIEECFAESHATIIFLNFSRLFWNSYVILCLLRNNLCTTLSTLMLLNNVVYAMVEKFKFQQIDIIICFYQGLIFWPFPVDFFL